MTTKAEWQWLWEQLQEAKREIAELKAELEQSRPKVTPFHVGGRFEKSIKGRVRG